MSGLIIPEITSAGREPPPMFARAAEDPETRRMLLQTLASYTVWLNRAFAQVHVALFSIAVILWSVGWPVRALTD